MVFRLHAYSRCRFLFTSLCVLVDVLSAIVDVHQP
jgi:hypothetical protein